MIKPEFFCSVQLEPEGNFDVEKKREMSLPYFPEPEIPENGGECRTIFRMMNAGTIKGSF